MNPAGPVGRAAVARVFEPEPRRVALDRLVPLYDVPVRVRRSRKWAQIAASVAEVGVVEPPVVARHPTERGRFLLLDGHVRVAVLRERGEAEALVLVATDDEAFTYNKRVSRLAAVQEHRMILEALLRNVPEERLARALDIDLSTLRRRRRALDGVCPEAVEILKDRPATLAVFPVLRRMAPLRQIEVAELMVAMNQYTAAYARTMLAATPASRLVPDGRPKAPKALSTEQAALMEREAAQLDRELKAMVESYGRDHMALVIARGYVAKLLGNARVARWLQQRHPEILAEFRSLGEAGAAAA